VQESFSSLLNSIWKKTNSYLCIGLDPDLKKLPKHLLSEKHPVFEFNRQLIEQTADLVCSYKPQLAYYSGQDIEDDLHLTMDFLAKYCPHIPIILDAKRGDIGSTAEMYAREAFSIYKAHAVTVNPYMGIETVEPFLSDKSKGVFVLCKTSNLGSGQFQNLKTTEGKAVYEVVAQAVEQRAQTHSGLGLVVGATHIQDLQTVRAMAPSVPLLVPGVGEQGGSLSDVLKFGRDKNGHGLVINSSRGIIYAGSDKDFAAQSRSAAQVLVKQMQRGGLS
jgi:orotidine-5'-phosphate decarboxylase